MDLIHEQARAAAAQREAIRREVRRLVPSSPVNVTAQNPVTGATTVVRTGLAVPDVTYDARTLLTPDAHDPAWTATLTGTAAQEIV